ncbi:hypothetical protein HY798_04120 [Candidatus Falkowbacteria bacterium]|nr:hypothetical protein [Candidatus Falkowbacteria bacterium]
MSRRRKNTKDIKSQKRKSIKKSGLSVKERIREKVLAEVKKEMAREEEQQAVIFDESDFARLDKSERDKKLIMWSGIVFFMVVILAGWIFSMKKMFKETELKGSNSEINWVKMAQDLDKTMDEMKKGLSQINSAGPNMATSSSAVSGLTSAENSAEGIAATSSAEIFATSTLSADEEKINELKLQLENK